MLNSEEEEEEEMLKKIYEISECLWKINNLKVLIVYQVVDRTKLSFRWTKTKVWLSLLTFNAILFFLLFFSYRFKGCIGHVTQTAPGESPRPLALRSSSWTGSHCESYCAPGRKCNPIDDVTRKECQCPGYENEDPICMLHTSRSRDDLATIILASSSTLSKSVEMTSNKSTPKLSSAIQTNVEATSSSKTTDSATPTSTQSASKHVQDSSGVKAQYVDVAYLDQQSSVPGNSSHPQPLGLVSASTRLFTPDEVFPSSVEVRPNSAVDNNSSVMEKKGSTSRILSSFVLICLAPAVSLLSGLMTR